MAAFFLFARYLHIFKDKYRNSRVLIVQYVVISSKREVTSFQIVSLINNRQVSYSLRLR